MVLPVESLKYEGDGPPLRKETRKERIKKGLTSLQELLVFFVV